MGLVTPRRCAHLESERERMCVCVCGVCVCLREKERERDVRCKGLGVWQVALTVDGVTNAILLRKVHYPPVFEY